MCTHPLEQLLRKTTPPANVLLLRGVLILTPACIRSYGNLSSGYFEPLINSRLASQFKMGKMH